MREVVSDSNNLNSTHSADVLQQLVYSISHDMGAPLRAVVQFSQLLEKRLKNRLDEKERYWLQLVQQGGEKGQEMLDGLLRYSRLASSDNCVTHFDLGTLVQTVIDTEVQKSESRHSKSRYPKSGHTLIARVTSNLPSMDGITDHWRLFFSCVINNAVTYQPKETNDHTPTVLVHCECIEGCNHIQIDDNGIGVSEKQRSELIRPFMRAQSAEDYPGIGMGFSYCDRIAQLHGGYLHFETSPLGGLRVVYSYPKSNLECSNGED
jgi:light-regulated signal transduction histidine kinase (bacteriophytochrome)